MPPWFPGTHLGGVDSSVRSHQEVVMLTYCLVALIILNLGIIVHQENQPDPGLK